MKKEELIVPPKALSDLYPLHDWVLVRKNYTRVTAGGIILAPRKEERPKDGTVLNIGKKVKELIPGDKIMFHYAAGTTFEYNGEKLSIIKECDIFGKLE